MSATHTVSMAAASSAIASSSAVAASKAPARTRSNSSSNWRGKYLRAVNVATPEVDVSSLKHPQSASSSHGAHSQIQTQSQLRRARSCRVDATHGVTFSSRNLLAERTGADVFDARVHRYQISHLARTSSRRQLSSSNNNSNNNASGYGFALKPDLARGRRCHTDPPASADDSDDSVSAPIQIPRSASAAAGGATMSELLGRGASSRSTSSAKLLSWEEPSAMLLPLDEPSSGLECAVRDMHLHTSAHSSVSSRDAFGRFCDDADGLCDAFVDTDSEDDVEDDDQEIEVSDGSDDEIFAMEDFDSNHSSSRSDDVASSERQRRRRLRTASVTVGATASQPISGRNHAALSRFHSVQQLRCRSASNNNALELRASFVPPHEMIERDCFSIGLRDAFKRRPAKI